VHEDDYNTGACWESNRRELWAGIRRVQVDIAQSNPRMAPLLPVELLQTLTRSVPCRELQLRQLATLYNVSARCLVWGTFRR
jgi:hypothetical protein